MKDDKTVWIIHQYASTPSTGMGGRHFYLAEELANQGYKVYIIASNANHLLRKTPHLADKYEFESISGFTFVWVKMPQYTDAHSRQRALNWFLFPWRIQQLAKIIPDKPNAILCSSPSPIAFLGAQRLAKHFNAQLVFEVRDIWPLTLTEIGGYSKNHPFIGFMQWVENKAYRDSDRVVSNLKGSVKHMIDHGLDRKKFYWIPNGISLKEVDTKYPLDIEILNKIPKNKFIIGYTGTLGEANAMQYLIEAARILKSHQNIHFVIVGSGKYKSKLIEMSNDLHITNITFLDPILKSQVPSILDKFDACYLGWHNIKLYKYGIGANKIPEYLYSGKPIIHSFSGNDDPIKKYNAGISVEAENPQAIADAVLKLYELPKDERTKLGKNGHDLAIAQYDYTKLAKELAEVLFYK